MKAPLIVANWKMHKTGQQAKDFLVALIRHGVPTTKRLCIAPAFTALEAAVQAARGSGIAIGAQNMHDQPEGAFTGEVSAEMLQAVGAAFVLLGHSERRQYFGETDAWIQRKVHRALKVGLAPFLCVGEQLHERDTGQWQTVLERQLGECLSGVSQQQIGTLTIAYEPVWAIGTGQVATPEAAEETHQWIRVWLQQHYGKEHAAQVPLLYGGSVKPENTAPLLAQPHIDGLLIGGASLDLEQLVQILNG